MSHHKSVSRVIKPKNYHAISVPKIISFHVSPWKFAYHLGNSMIGVSLFSLMVMLNVRCLKHWASSKFTEKGKKVISVWCVLFYFILFYFFNVYFSDRGRQSMSGEGQRERHTHRIWNRLHALSCQHRSQCGSRTHEPWDHDLSWSRCLTDWATQEPPVWCILEDNLILTC